MPVMSIIEKGDKYNKLTIVKELSPHRYPNGLTRRKFLCKCDCGRNCEILINRLRSGHSKSCGCHNIDQIIKRNTTHGLNGSKPWNSRRAMKERCGNKKFKQWKDYGGRGIGYTESLQTFEGFRQDMGGLYREGFTIDRIDVNGNYCQENCRWATHKEQNSNKRHL